MTSSIILGVADECGEEKRRVRRGETRREEVAAVAQRIFLERGYNQTTMQAIAEQAGASKETLYRHFGSKEGLFAEIVRVKAAQIALRLDEEMTLHSNPRDILTRVGSKLIKTLICCDVLSFYAWIVAETPRAPELGRIFYELGPAMVRSNLKDYLERATAQNVLCCENPMLAAKLFLGSIMADIHLRALTVGVADGIDEAEINERVEGAVSMFLARYGTPAKL